VDEPGKMSMVFNNVVTYGFDSSKFITILLRFLSILLHILSLISSSSKIHLTYLAYLRVLVHFHMSIAYLVFLVGFYCVSFVFYMFVGVMDNYA
jgi:hypothetical protein